MSGMIGEGTERRVYALGPRLVLKVPQHGRRQFQETNACELEFWRRVQGTPDRVYFAACFWLMPDWSLVQERVAWTYAERGEDVPESLKAVGDRWGIVELVPRNAGLGYDGYPKAIDYQDGEPWRGRE